MALTRRLERKQVADEDDGAPDPTPAPDAVSAHAPAPAPAPAKRHGRVTRLQSGIRMPKRPFTAADAPARAKKRRARPASPAPADDEDEVPTRPATPEPAPGFDGEQTLVAEDTAATLVDAAAWLPKARRRGRPVPVPVPNLTKKSRGRRVPTAVPARADARSPSPPRAYACHVAGCGKLFHRGEHLKRHIRSIHTNEKPFPCPAPNCGKFFSRHDNLLQHQKIHKGGAHRKGKDAHDEDEDEDDAELDEDEPRRAKRKARRSASPDAPAPAPAPLAAAPAAGPSTAAPTPGQPLRIAYHYQLIPAPPGGMIPPGMIGVPIPVAAPDGGGGGGALPYPYGYSYGHYPVYSFHPPPGAILVGAPAVAVSSVRTGQEDGAEAEQRAALPVLPAYDPTEPEAFQATMQAINSYYGAPAAALPAGGASIAELPGTPLPPAPVDGGAVENQQP